MKSANGMCRWRMLFCLQAMIPGTVLCVVSAGHDTAGLSPVSWREIIACTKSRPHSRARDQICGQSGMPFWSSPRQMGDTRARVQIRGASRTSPPTVFPRARDQRGREISRPPGVREVQTIEYRLYRTIEPKQRGAGARVSSDARRVCDASGQEKGTPERMRPGRKGCSYEIGIAIRLCIFVENFSTFLKRDYFSKAIAQPLSPRYAALRGPLPSPGGTAFWGFTTAEHVIKFAGGASPSPTDEWDARPNSQKNEIRPWGG